MDWRKTLTRGFLFISVLAWGPLLGAKVFDLVVLVGAWSAAPPESLRLLPYGADYPVDTGAFFIPSSAALLFSTFGALACGWKTPLKFRALLGVSAMAIFATLVLTVVCFWPLNAALWAYASRSPKATWSVGEIVQMTHLWVAMDLVRVGVAIVGYLAATVALSAPFPAARAPKDPLVVTILLAVGLIGVASFLVYFVSNI